MTTQDGLEEYKKAIRLKFEQEKTKEYSSFLFVPSRAKLRKLCLERMKKNSNPDDLNSFYLFLGFEFSVSNINKLKAQNDKFRPIETFFKGETDLTDVEAVNIAAVLVDFNPRPFRKFSRKNISGQDSDDQFEEETALQEKPSEELQPLIQTEQKPKPKNSLKQRIAIGSFIVLSAFGVKQTIFKDKECMQWQKDHYERVACDCEIDSLASSTKIFAFDEQKVHLRKFTPCDTTQFFMYDKPLVWYHKVSSGEIEYFNRSGNHPVTDEELKPITKYMIKKYLSKSK